MRTACLLVFGALLLLPTALPAQSIRGVVREDGTRTPIVDALVELFDTASARVASARTDSIGAFVLSPGRPGSFRVRLTHLGYAPVDSVELEAQRGESLQIELRMAQAAIPLEPLVVTTRRNRRLEEFYERSQRPGFGRFLTREDIARRPATQTTDLLRGMAGIQIVQSTDRGVIGVNLITMRGGAGRCQPTIYIDGMEVKQFPESGVDQMLTPYVLEGVEVYPSLSGAPSSLHALSNCGVVAFWTRADIGRRWSWKRLAIAVGGFVLLVMLLRR